jgi:hypothetical protein
MRDVTDYKLHQLEDNLEWVFDKRNIKLEDVYVVTKPFRLSPSADITFVVKNLDPTLKESLIESLKSVIVARVEVVSYEENKHLTKVSHIKKLLEKGKNDAALRDDVLVPALVIIERYRKDHAMLDLCLIKNIPVIEATFKVSCHYFDIVTHGPDNEILKATFSLAFQNIIEECFTWNPFVVAANGKFEIMNLYLSTPGIREKILDNNFKDKHGQTCLQKAIFCRYYKIVHAIIHAIGSEGIDAYLKIKDKDNCDCYDTAKSMGYYNDLVRIVESLTIAAISDNSVTSMRK